MTIERAFFEDTWEIHCDRCSYYEEIKAADFEDMIAEVKKRGWKSLQKDGRWEHLCPTCQDKEKGLI